MVGTARYASPEQARGEPVDGRADVYALGLVLIEAVTGKVPFAADTTIGTLMARIDTPVEVPASMGALQKLLARAGQPSPADRPDAGEFGVGLMAAAEELDRPAPLPLAGVMGVGVATAAPVDPTLLPGGGDETGVVRALGTGEPVGTSDGEVPLDLPAPPRRRRRWLRAAIVLLLVASLVGAGWYASQTVLVPSHEVPSLVGLDRAAAEALVEENGWELEVEEGRDDASVAGQVLAQDPPAGESLKEGEEVVLTISLGRELRAVPTDLADLPLADAEARIAEAGLTVGEHQRANSEDVAADHVISLVEGTPDEAETGTAISLVVSDGPVARVVPALAAGSDPAAACAPIEAQQLVCEQAQQFDEVVPNGQVIGTDPPAGTEVERGSTVRVLVSQGPQLVPVPDVSGRSVDEAVQVLESAGLTVVGVTGNPRGTVLATDPPAGEQVRLGTGVVIFARR
jgi:beta-lactam-binding protein with PASTA domain